MVLTLVSDLERRTNACDATHGLNNRIQAKLDSLMTECFGEDVKQRVKRQVQLSFVANEILAVWSTVPYPLDTSQGVPCDLLRTWIDGISGLLTVRSEPVGYRIYNVCKNMSAHFPMRDMLNFVVANLVSHGRAIELDVWLYNLHFSKAFQLYTQNGFEQVRRDGDNVVLRYNPSVRKTRQQAVLYQIQALEHIRRDPSLSQDQMDRIDDILLHTKTQPVDTMQVADELPIYGIFCHGESIDSYPADLDRKGSVPRPSSRPIDFVSFDTLGVILFSPTTSVRYKSDPMHVSDISLCELRPPNSEVYINDFPESRLVGDETFQARVVCKQCNYKHIYNISSVHDTLLSDILTIIETHQRDVHEPGQTHLTKIQVNCWFCTTPSGIPASVDESIYAYLRWWMKYTLKQQHIPILHSMVNDQLISLIKSYDPGMYDVTIEFEKFKTSLIFLNRNEQMLLLRYIDILSERITKTIDTYTRLLTLRMSGEAKLGIIAIGNTYVMIKRRLTLLSTYLSELLLQDIVMVDVSANPHFGKRRIRSVVKRRASAKKKTKRRASKVKKTKRNHRSVR